MRTFPVAALAVNLALLAGAGAVRAGTLATGLLYWDDGTPVVTCFVSNIGSKAVTITSVTIQDASPTELTLDSESCTTAPLAPGHSCLWQAIGSGYGGGKLQSKGSVKSLRGRCVLRDSTTGDVLGSAAELR